MIGLLKTYSLCDIAFLRSNVNKVQACYTPYSCDADMS